VGYRPITDAWILARPKVKYYGAYPAGFLSRARALLGVGRTGAVLHVCGGKVRDYPGPHMGIYYRGLGPNDKTLDLDPSLDPDYVHDARQPFPLRKLSPTGVGGESLAVKWDAVLIDRPYTPADAAHYAPGPDRLPTSAQVVGHALAAVGVGGKVGILDYEWPRPPKDAVEVAVVFVTTGRGNRARQFTVFERLEVKA